MATAAPRKSAASGKTLSRRILVNVKRDQTAATPRVIWAHEFPILEAIFGEGTVTQLPAESLDEGYSAKAGGEILPFNKKQDTAKRPSESVGIGFVFTGDARSEFERLAGVYGRDAEVNQAVVETVYGRFNTGVFESALGLAEYSDMPDAQLRELVIGHGYLPLVGHDSSPEERKEAEAMRTKLNTMGREELLALAEELAGALV